MNTTADDALTLDEKWPDGVPLPFDPLVLNPHNPSFVTWNTYLKKARHWIGFARSHEPKMAPVYFEFVNSPKLNAVAVNYEGHQSIGLYGGAFVLMLDLFMSLMTNPDYAPLIGDVTREVARTAPHIGCARNAEDIPISEVVPPRDPQRLIYAALLTDIAFHFLVAHEFAHLLCGHVAFAGGATGVRALYEKSAFPHKGLTGLEAQAIEIGADSFATAQGLPTAFTRCDHHGQISPGFVQFYGSYQEAAATWWRAIYGLFCMFGQDRYDYTKLDHLSHPPPRVRQAIQHDYVFNLIASHGHPELQEPIWNSVCDMMLETEKAVAHASGQPFDFFQLDNSSYAYGQAGRDHLKKLQATWVGLAPRVEPFSQESSRVPSLSAETTRIDE